MACAIDLQIDPILFLQPVAALAISLGILFSVLRNRGSRGTILILSLLAYFLAIALKVVVQLVSYDTVVSTFGYSSLGTALYLGLQTVLFEVGFGYLFACYGVRRKGLTTGDAVSYGASLSFWENGVLLGILSLFQLTVIYLILSSGGSIASTVASDLPSAYFAAAPVAAGGVALGTIERISSMLIHIAWGVLCVLTAISGKKRFLAVALPMGLVDAIVPFSGLIGLILFEAIVFAISVACLGIALVALRTVKSKVSPPDTGGFAKTG